MTREEFRFGLAARYMEKANMTTNEARDLADYWDDRIIDDYIASDFDGAAAADDDMSYWEDNS